MSPRRLRVAGHQTPGQRLLQFFLQRFWDPFGPPRAKTHKFTKPPPERNRTPARDFRRNMANVLPLRSLRFLATAQSGRPGSNWRIRQLRPDSSRRGFPPKIRRS